MSGMHLPWLFIVVHRLALVDVTPITKRAVEDSHVFQGKQIVTTATLGVAVRMMIQVRAFYRLNKH